LLLIYLFFALGPSVEAYFVLFLRCAGQLIIVVAVILMK